jgi:hypothetical protein
MLDSFGSDRQSSKGTKAQMVLAPAAYRYELAATVQVHLFAQRRGWLKFIGC